MRAEAGRRGVEGRAGVDGYFGGGTMRRSSRRGGSLIKTLGISYGKTAKIRGRHKCPRGLHPPERKGVQKGCQTEIKLTANYAYLDQKMSLFNIFHHLFANLKLALF